MRRWKEALVLLAFLAGCPPIVSAGDTRDPGADRVVTIPDASDTMVSLGGILAERVKYEEQLKKLSEQQHLLAQRQAQVATAIAQHQGYIAALTAIESRAQGEVEE